MNKIDILESPRVMKYMRLNMERCRDPRTGELNHTLLAETVANELDLYEGDDYDIPEELFEVAASYD